MAISEWGAAEWKRVGIGCFQVLMSFLCFRCMQFAVRWYLFGKCTFRTFSYFGRRQNVAGEEQPADVDFRSSQSLQVVPPNKKWRISNEAVSLIHSVVAGSWALYACLVYPQLLENMVYFDVPFADYLVIVSTGYLIHDLTDLLVNERSLRILELLFHHVIVLLAFAIPFVTSLFLGVVICGLLMEVNSIFLHSRSLLNLYGVPKTSTAFRIVALLNILTFATFRMAVSGYLLYWQVTTVWSMYWGYALATFITILFLAFTNVVLCYRVMAADGLLGARRGRRQPVKAPEDPSLGTVIVSPQNNTTSQLIKSPPSTHEEA